MTKPEPLLDDKIKARITIGDPNVPLIDDQSIKRLVERAVGEAPISPAFAQRIEDVLLLLREQYEALRVPPEPTEPEFVSPGPFDVHPQDSLAIAANALLAAQGDLDFVGVSAYASLAQAAAAVHQAQYSERQVVALEQIAKAMVTSSGPKRSIADLLLYLSAGRG